MIFQETVLRAPVDPNALVSHKYNRRKVFRDNLAKSQKKRSDLAVQHESTEELNPDDHTTNPRYRTNYQVTIHCDNQTSCILKYECQAVCVT